MTARTEWRKAMGTVNDFQPHDANRMVDLPKSCDGLNKSSLIARDAFHCS